jgi:hypothetical protein
MKQFLLIPLSLLACAFSYAQTSANQKHFTFHKQAEVNYSAIGTDYNPKLMLSEMPKQRSEKMEIYNYPEKAQDPSAKKQAGILPNLTKGQSFFANSWGFSTPNDNDMAISDSGMVLSVVNTNIFVRNTLTNVNAPYKSLAAFTSPINSKHQEFDAKVMYDPLKDRFVLLCLVGFVDTTSKIIIGFSQSNDPSGNWNLYLLPGNPLNNNLWTDYPMIAMTEKELFLSVNLLVNNQPWQTGFVETIIWQMKKDSGYLGAPLGAVLHNNIQFNGKPIRNLCPVKGGSKLYKPNMYFISNRNLASQNDTVFLVNLTDTIGAPTGTVTVKALVSNQSYYFPPHGRQTVVSDSLATNDSRNLGAFYENYKIQYVHNTGNPANGLASVYYGVINNPQAASPIVSGYILQNDTVDFAYPNISYAGKSNMDNTAIINFDHSSDKIFPGCSAIRADGAGDFSPVLRIQNGVNHINLLASSLERWGDYSGSQLKYNNPGEVWVSGYYGYYYSAGYPRAHGAWIAQLGLDDGLLTDVKAKQAAAEGSARIFPNPSNDIFSVELNLAAPEYLSFELFDLQGKRIELLLRDWVKVKQNVFSFSTRSLAKGTYLLKISGNLQTNFTKKVMVQ